MTEFLTGGPDALRRAAATFLAARGLAVEEPELGLLIARGPAGAVAAITPSAADGGVDPARALTLLASARAAGADGPVPIVARTRRGVGEAEGAAIRAEGGTIVTPLGFFDFYFKASDAAERGDEPPLYDALYDLYRRAGRASRILGPQPYRRLEGMIPPRHDDGPDGRDLLATLTKELTRPPAGPTLTVLCGPAGVGKTLLISALLRRMQDVFNRAKISRDAPAARPLLFEPDQLGSREPPENIAVLIDALYGSRLAGRMPSEAFEWLHRSGLNLWIFDGLDEFYRQQNDFFANLSAKLRDPHCRAQTVLCTRDSLLSSGVELQGFLSQEIDRRPSAVRLYELMLWERDDKRAYFAAALRDEEAAGAAAAADHVVEQLDANPTLTALTARPYYASVFLDAHRQGAPLSGEQANEFDMLDFAIQQLIDREEQKLAIDWSDFVTEADQRELSAEPNGEAQVRRLGRLTFEYILGSAAHYFCYDQPAGGFRLGQISAREWSSRLGGFLRQLGHPQQTVERYELLLLQSPLFARGDEDGFTTFVHDLEADFLAARFAIDELRQDPRSNAVWAIALGRRHPLDDTLFFRFMADAVASDRSLRDGAVAALDSQALTAEQKTTLSTLIAAADPRG